MFFLTTASESLVNWMLLRPDKVGTLRDHFLSALRLLMARVGDVEFQPDMACLDDLQLDALGSHVRRLLDANLPDWRDDVMEGRRVFAFQVPELWTALRWILQNT